MVRTMLQAALMASLDEPHPGRHDEAPQAGDRSVAASRDREGAPPVRAEAQEELLALKSGAVFVCARPDGDIRAARVPDESTIRKLVKRLGPEVIDEITMRVLRRATSAGGERRFVVRAARIDSTVIEADIRHPTDLGLAQDAARMLAAEAKRAADLAGDGAPRVTRGK
jgi:hypothetical protein